MAHIGSWLVVFSIWLSGSVLTLHSLFLSYLVMCPSSLKHICQQQSVSFSTHDASLVYKGCSSSNNIMWGYVDWDWARDTESGRFMSGYIIMLNCAAIIWKSKRQQPVAMSTAEAEFVAVSSCREILYLWRLLNELGFPQQSPTVVNKDNRTVIAWSEGAVGGTSTFSCAMQWQMGKPIASSDNMSDLLT